MQQRLPNTVLGEIVGDAFRDQNMTGFTAIHHALRNVDSDTGDVRLIIHILQLIDWPAVHTHAQSNGRVVFQSLRDFHCAMHRLLWALKEDQRHAVTSCNANQFAARTALLKLRSRSHNLIELLHHFSLLVYE